MQSVMMREEKKFTTDITKSIDLEKEASQTNRMKKSDLSCEPSDHFYENIPAFSEFSEIMKTHHYTPVPDSWWIFIADIKGSAKAIEEGRYRDVNMIGAACIASVLNVVKPLRLP